ncbi:hypothetical protein OEM_21960 [Mycobacterium intracellulare subsp. yongonense 05-1390]|nr:hypothetical protein OEM_21960 [Mycobacterium intracellulare subsp. yongonense 05-1390]ETZ36243.1 hypothetical protein L843_2564 [Mycobacterium intracellulare MIN_061107_1834]
MTDCEVNVNVGSLGSDAYGSGAVLMAVLSGDRLAFVN